MIKEFVERFEAGKAALHAQFSGAHPEDYKSIVTAVVSVVTGSGSYDGPDPKRIHEINDGSYQGTLVYVIGGKGYQPSDYWYVKVGYGSCSGCDTLEGIRSYSNETPNEGQAKDYMTLALHVVQGLVLMGDEVA